jgi:hypothetical protein
MPEPESTVSNDGTLIAEEQTQQTETAEEHPPISEDDVEVPSMDVADEADDATQDTGEDDEADDAAQSVDVADEADNVAQSTGEDDEVDNVAQSTDEDDAVVPQTTENVVEAETVVEEEDPVVQEEVDEATHDRTPVRETNVPTGGQTQTPTIISSASDIDETTLPNMRINEFIVDEGVEESDGEQLADSPPAPPPPTECELISGNSVQCY